MIWNGPLSGSGADCTPALVAMCQSPVNDGEIKFPWGTFTFLTQPPPDILDGMRLRGNSKETTTFIPSFDGGGEPFLIFTGARNNGQIIEAINIAANPNFPIRTAIYLAGNALSQPDATILRELSITGNWLSCIALDGSARASPQGVRSVLIEDCDLFGATGFPHIMSTNAVALKIRGGGCYAAGSNGGGVSLNGGSCCIDIQGHTNNYPLVLDTCAEISVYGGCVGSIGINNAKHVVIETSPSWLGPNRIVIP